MMTIETKLQPLAKVLEQYVPVKKSCKGFYTKEDIKEALGMLEKQISLELHSEKAPKIKLT